MGRKSFVGIDGVHALVTCKQLMQSVLAMTVSTFSSVLPLLRPFDKYPCKFSSYSHHDSSLGHEVQSWGSMEINHGGGGGGGGKRLLEKAPSDQGVVKREVKPD